MADDFKPKRSWPDDEERVVDGSNIMYGPACCHRMAVNEIPSEVHKIVRSASEDMITLHHHSDPEVEVYVNHYNITAIDARWKRIDED